ncbi:MAG: hypothetical protein JXX14_17985 [Deltaproteobacteria bacterium]|nr:hypothetical protein [Deltaproteobacteria bacterium]
MDTDKPNNNEDVIEEATSSGFDDPDDEAEYQKLFGEVCGLFEVVIRASWQEASACRPVVDKIIKTGCQDENLISHLFDRVHDTGYCPAGWKLFNRLTKYCDTFAPHLSLSAREFWYDEYINDNTADLDGEGWDW